MLWSEVLVLATVVVLFGTGFAVSLRRGAAVSETAHLERKQVLAALGLLAAVVGMALIYALGSGVSDGAGGTEAFATMAMVSVMGTAAAYTAPALATAALLRPGASKSAAAPPGWYTDPVSLGSQRYWDGSSWTNQSRPVEEPSDSTASG
jgi:hypothetical protein